MSATLLLALGLLAQEPAPPAEPAAEGEAQAQAEEEEPQDPWVFEALDVSAEADADEVVYRITGLTVEGPDFSLRAENALVRLDAARYLLYQDRDQMPPPPEPDGRLLLPGLWSRRILGSLGLPEDETLIRAIDLDGDVLLVNAGVRAKASRLRDWPVEGRAEAFDIELRLPPGSGAPNAWPLTIQARYLREDSDGSIAAKGAAFSTCDADPLHWSVRFQTVTAQREKDGSVVWNPGGAWLRAGRIPLLPIPAPEFRAGDNFMGLRGIRLESSRHFGLMLEPRFGWGWTRLSWRSGIRTSIASVTRTVSS